MAMYLLSNGTGPLVAEVHGGSMEGESEGAEALLMSEKEGFSAVKVVGALVAGVAVDDWVVDT
jgi:hypothetical protein